MNIKRWLRRCRASLNNRFWFVTIAIWRGIPFHKWAYYWARCEAELLAQTRKTVWELKCKGLVYEDERGHLWSKKDRE